MTFYFFQFLQSKRKAHRTTLLLLLIMLPGAAGATVYQCLTQDEILFLTNIRNNFPPGCRQVGEPIGEESAALSPVPISSSTLDSDREMNDRQRSSLPPRSQAPKGPSEEASSEGPNQVTEPLANIPGVLTHKKELGLWNGLAQRMAARYQAIQNSPGSPSEKAEKLEKLETNLRMLRDGLATSPLSAEEQAEIETNLPQL